MAKRSAQTEQNAFPFAARPHEDESTVLTLVGAVDASLELGAETTGAQSSTVRKFGRPGRRLGVQTRQTGRPVRASSGRPDAQIGRPEWDAGRPKAETSSVDESHCPSRQKGRLNLRGLNRKLLRLLKKECESVDPPLKLYEVTQDALRLWLRARADAKLGVQTPTCSSSSSLNTDLDLTTTTTTTTLGVQTPKSVQLPGFAAKVLEHQPHDSRHALAVNLAYAWWAHENKQGIKVPDYWAMSNWRSGKHDALIDLWLKRNEERDAKQSTPTNDRSQQPSADSLRRRALGKGQENLWARIVAVLRDKVTQHTVETWFVPIQFECVEGSVLHLCAPNQIVVDWVISNYSDLLSEAFAALKLTGLTISWSTGRA